MESKNLLRLAALALLFLIIIGVALGRIRRLEKALDACRNAPADTVTQVRIDTFFVERPVPVAHYVKDTQYIVLTDTQIVHDTIQQTYTLKREFAVYADSSYRAVVSGVQPRLDTLQLFSKTVTNTVTKTVTQVKKTRWGLGLQAGCGWNGKKLSPYVGAGVQYNLFSW